MYEGGDLYAQRYVNPYIQYFENDRLTLEHENLDMYKQEERQQYANSAVDEDETATAVLLNEEEQRNGQLKKKHKLCTDFLFLFLLLCFLLFLSALYSGVHYKWTPQPKSLIYPTDSIGRSCGSQNRKYSLSNNKNTLQSVNKLSIPYDPSCQESVYSEKCQAQVLKLLETYSNKEEFYDMRNKPYLYFLDAANPETFGGICVSYCPGMKPGAHYCPPELTPNTDANGTETGGCSYKRPDGKVFVEADELQFNTILNRCIPTKQSLTAAHLSPSPVLKKYADMLPPTLSESVAYVIRQWKLILLSLVISLLLGFIFVVVIRLFAKFFVWFVILTVFFLLVTGSVLSLMEAFQWRKKYFPSNSMNVGDNFYSFNSKFSSEMYGVIGIGLIITLFIYIWFLSSYAKYVQRALSIMREAARGVSAIPQLLLFSVGMFFILLIFYMYWFLMSINIWSSGSTVVEKQNTVFLFSSAMRFISIFHLFAFFWISQLIVAFTTTTVASVICEWYFTSKQKRNTVFLTMPVLRAACTLLFYNMGSIAFGALVVGTVKFMSFVLKRIIIKTEAMLRNRTFIGTIAIIFAWIIRLLIAVFNKVVSTISKHAYIQVAIYGTGFLESSRNAVSLLHSHTAQILILDWIVDWVIFCGKVCIAATTCFIVYWLSLIVPSNSGTVEPTSNFSLVLFAVIFCSSYLIASLFLSIYEVATDTIVQCYLIDEQLCTDDPSRRMCCSSELLGVMEFERRMNEEELKTNGELLQDVQQE